MKNGKFWTVWIGLLVAGSGYAAVDPDPDQIGVYFDLEAETVCREASANVPLYAYIIITNPTSDVLGSYFTVCSEVPPGFEAMLFTLPRIWPEGCPPPIDTSIIDECQLGYMYSCYEPITPGPGGVVVMTHQYMLLGDIPVDFYVGPLPGGDFPAYRGADDAIIPLGISSGSPDLPVAQINGDCRVVPVETATFGRLKGLYR